MRQSVSCVPGTLPCIGTISDNKRWQAGPWMTVSTPTTRRHVKVTAKTSPHVPPQSLSDLDSPPKSAVTLETGSGQRSSDRGGSGSACRSATGTTQTRCDFCQIPRCPPVMRLSPCDGQSWTRDRRLEGNAHPPPEWLVLVGIVLVAIQRWR